MSEVYVVTSGSYSDYGIRGIFSTKKNADEFIERAGALKDDDGDRLEYWSGDVNGVEIWELDAALKNKRMRIWTCGMLLDDGAIVEPKIEWSEITWEPPFRSRVIQYGTKVPAYSNRPIVRIESAVSQAHANKVAAEKRQEWLRRKESR